MDESPSPRIFELPGPGPEAPAHRPLPQVSDLERAFWRRAVDLERRRLVTRRYPIPVPVR